MRLFRAYIFVELPLISVINGLEFLLWPFCLWKSGSFDIFIRMKTLLIFITILISFAADAQDFSFVAYKKGIAYKIYKHNDTIEISSKRDIKKWKVEFLFYALHEGWNIYSAKLISDTEKKQEETEIFADPMMRRAQVYTGNKKEDFINPDFPNGPSPKP